MLRAALTLSCLVVLLPLGRASAQDCVGFATTAFTTTAATWDRSADAPNNGRGLALAHLNARSAEELAELAALTWSLEVGPYFSSEGIELSSGPLAEVNDAERNQLRALLDGRLLGTPDSEAPETIAICISSDDPRCSPAHPDSDPELRSFSAARVVLSSDMNDGDSFIDDERVEPVGSEPAGRILAAHLSRLERPPQS